MKAAELRIGNWISTIEGPVQVTAMSHEGLMATSIMTGGDLLGWAEPITITNEWLVKFGFEVDVLCRDVFYIPYQAGYLTVCTGNYEHTGFVKDKGDMVLYISFGDIKYVHQLQNLYFALTEKELTV